MHTLLSRSLTILFGFYLLAETCSGACSIADLTWRSAALLTFLLTELLQGLLLLFAKPTTIPVRSTWSFVSPILLITISMFGGTTAIGSMYRGYLDSAGTVLLYIGLLLALWSTLSIGSSFGVFAEVRVVRTTGAYRFMRHPIYTAYFVQYAGVALTSHSLKTAIVMLLACVVQIWRAVQEEKVLCEVPDYLDYATKTGMFVPCLHKRKGALVWGSSSLSS